VPTVDVDRFATEFTLRQFPLAKFRLPRLSLCQESGLTKEQQTGATSTIRRFCGVFGTFAKLSPVRVDQESGVADNGHFVS